jgi:ABC-2 type transport system permease protein
MSGSLVSPDARPLTERRPRGTSFAGLVGVELRRLWWRRLTKGVLLGVLAVLGLAAFSIYQDTAPANLAERVEQYNLTVEQMRRDQASMTPEQRAEQIAACKRDQASIAAETGDVADFGCDRMFALPSPADYGLTSTSSEAIARSIVVQGVYVFGFLAFILGASFVAAEFATGSMGTWLTFQPRRLRVASAKLCAAALGGLAVGVVAVVLGLLCAAMISTVNRPGDDLPLVETTATGSLWQELARAVVAITLGGLGGAVIGFLLRSTAGVIGAVLGWVVVVEGLVGSTLAGGRLQPWLVRTNLDAFVNDGTSYTATTCGTGGCQTAPVALSFTHGWVYLLVVTTAGVVAALLLFRRRDVT